MTHDRVTKEGKDMGRHAARLARLGKARLVRLGLANVAAPNFKHEMCKTCACQSGSVPNGCPQTQMDFLKSAHEGNPFLCHAPMNGQICAGWLWVRAELMANPLPKIVTDFLDNWDYSPPDETLKARGGSSE